MSKKINEQRGDLQAAYKEESVKINRDKKKVQQIWMIQLHLQAHQKMKQWQHQVVSGNKKNDDLSSDSEDDKGQNLMKQTNMMSQAAIVATTKYAKLIQEIAEPLPNRDSNWQNADKR